MGRGTGLVLGVLAVAAAAVVAGAVVPLREGVSAGRTADVRLDHKTGYFNLPRIMRESNRGRTKVARLNAQRVRMSANLMGLRAMHVDLERELATTQGFSPESSATRERIGRDLLTVRRLIEDTDRQINKVLNDRASEIIAELYCDIRDTAAELAQEHGLDAVLAYPGNPATENPQEMELMLKSPADQPFYLDPAIEFTDEMLRRLNKKFAAEREPND
jgi:Skp family chaperone for outer membrane proteins